MHMKGPILERKARKVIFSGGEGEHQDLRQEGMG